MLACASQDGSAASSLLDHQRSTRKRRGGYIMTSASSRLHKHSKHYFVMLVS